MHSGKRHPLEHRDRSVRSTDTTTSNMASITTSKCVRAILRGDVGSVAKNYRLIQLNGDVHCYRVSTAMTRFRSNQSVPDMDLGRQLAVCLRLPQFRILCTLNYIRTSMSICMRSHFFISPSESSTRILLLTSITSCLYISAHSSFIAKKNVSTILSLFKVARMS